MLVASDEVEELVVGAVGFVGAVRQPLPGERGAGAAAAAPPARAAARRCGRCASASSQLLAVASRYGSFPIILETYRECLQDVFDLPALRELLAAIERREVRVVSVETPRASPFASSLLFDYIAAYMYEGDAPLVDRRAQALALDRDLLRELLGAEELRELLDADALGELELELQALTLERAAGSADQVHDLLRGLGDLSTDGGRRPGPGRGCARRAAAPPGSGWRRWPRTAARWRCASRARRAGSPPRTSARYRDAVGVAPPRGVPDAFLAPDPGCARRPAVALRAPPRAVPAGRAGRALGTAARRRRDRRWST